MALSTVIRLAAVTNEEEITEEPVEVTTVEEVEAEPTELEPTYIPADSEGMADAIDEAVVAEDDEMMDED